MDKHARTDPSADARSTSDEEASPEQVTQHEKRRDAGTPDDGAASSSDEGLPQETQHQKRRDAEQD